MKRVIVSILAVFATLYLAVAGLLYTYQRDLLYFPDVQRPFVNLSAVPSLKEVELVTSDQLHLLAWYIPPLDGKPLILYFHGNGGHIGYRAPRLIEFAQAGFGVLMPEYRGYGGNEGRPSEAGFYLDAAAAIDFLRREGIGPERIIVYGESLGTGVATLVASEHPIAALVLESPYTSIAAMASRQFYLLPVNLMLSDRFDSLSRIAKVRAPVLIIHGEQDQIVPPELGRELFAAAPEPKLFWSVPEAGHNDLYQYDAATTVLEFLHQHVPAAK